MVVNNYLVMNGAVNAVQQKMLDKHTRNVFIQVYVLVAISASLLLHTAIALWWLSRPVQMPDMSGMEMVTVDLITLASPAPTEQPAPEKTIPTAQPEPDVLQEDEMALKHNVIKKQQPKKPRPAVHTVTDVKRNLTEQQQVSAEEQNLSVATHAPTPVSEARYDANYLNNPAPTYPSLSRRLGEEGRVLLRVHVSAEGKALVVEIKKSSGFQRLDAAAVNAAEKWRFVPARQGGMPIVSTVEVPMQFSLQK